MVIGEGEEQEKCKSEGKEKFQKMRGDKSKQKAVTIEENGRNKAKVNREKRKSSVK